MSNGLSHRGAQLPSLMRAYIRGDANFTAESKELTLEQAMDRFYLDPNLFDDSSSDEDTNNDEEGENDTKKDTTMLPTEHDETKQNSSKGSLHQHELFRPNDLPEMPIIRTYAHGSTRKPTKLAVIEKLMDHSHDVHSRDVYGNTAMHWACHGLATIPDVDEYAKRLLNRLSRELNLRKKQTGTMLERLEYSKIKRKHQKKRIKKGQTQIPIEETLSIEELTTIIVDIHRQLATKDSQRQNRCLALIERLQKHGGASMLSQLNYAGLSPLHFAARTCHHPLLADSLIHGYQKSKLTMQLGMAEIFESVRDATQKLLECDRVTLFLADPSNSTLWSIVADKSLPIKLPWDKGLAGMCYEECEICVISKVQVHDKFDKTWDERSGYVTRSMILAPLINEYDTNIDHRLPDAEPASKANAVYGVIQCINKISKNYDKNGHLRFTKQENETEGVQSDSQSDRELLLRVASMVSKAIHKVYLAWSLGGGQETKNQQEKVEEELRTKLMKMLEEKYTTIEKVVKKVLPAVEKYFESRKDHQMRNTPKEKYKHYMSLDDDTKMESFQMTEQDLHHCSGSMLFQLKSCQKEKVAQLSPGFQIHGPDRYINPKLLIHDSSMILIDDTLSKRRTCRSGVNIPTKPSSYARMELVRMKKVGVVNALSSDGSTALMMAAATGNMIFIHYLLEAGADPYVADRRGNTALHYAAMFDHEQAAAYLLSVGADPFAINRKGCDAYKTAVDVLFDAGHSRMLCMLSGAKAIWLRAGRGAREEHVCNAAGTRCSLTFGSPAESRFSRSCGHCPWCNTTTTPTVDHLKHCPDRQDTQDRNTKGKTWDERWAKAAVREGKLRKDADAMEFWLNRSMLPLNHIEIASIPSHRIINHGIQNKVNSSGYPGTTVGGFHILLEKEQTKDSEEGEEEVKDEVEETTEEKKIKKIKKKKRKKTVIKLSKVDGPKDLLPRGWRCLSFTIRMKDLDDRHNSNRKEMMRITKNPYVRGNCVRITATVLMDESYLHQDISNAEEVGESSNRSNVSSKARKSSIFSSQRESNGDEPLSKAEIERDQKKKDKSMKIKKRFQSKVKARMALGMFQKAGESRQNKWKVNENYIFGHDKKQHKHHQNVEQLSPSPQHRPLHSTLSPPTLHLNSTNSNQATANHGTSSTIKRRALRSIAIPLHSASIVLTKSGDPSKYGNNIMTLFLTEEQNIFIYPHAQYEITIDEGSLLVGKRDPLSSCR